MSFSALHEVFSQAASTELKLDPGSMVRKFSSGAVDRLIASGSEEIKRALRAGDNDHVAILIGRNVGYRIFQRLTT